MDVHLLGQIEAVDGGPLALGGPTQRRVLAALALHRNEVVSIPHLVEVIWAETAPPDRAEHNVRTYVHRLRSSLDGHGERIDTVGSGYRIRLDDDELDVARFEQLAGTAKRLADTGEAVAALDLIDEAERLWRGAPVEEFEHEAWAMPDAIRLRELYSLLRVRRAELLLELGRPGEATAMLEVLVRAEPLREQPRALLIRALYESGRQADSLRAFQEFRQTLIDEVGIEPSADLVDLDRSIASGRLAATATDSHRGRVRPA